MGNAAITIGSRLGRSKVLRSSRRYLRAKSRGHYTLDCMKARGVANRKRPIIYLTRTEKGPSFTLTYPLTARIVCSTDDITTNFLYFSLFSTTFWDLMNSRPVHFLMLSSHLFFCLPCSLPPSPCLSRWFWPDLMNGRHVHTTPVCVSLRRLGGLRGIDCLLDLRYPAAVSYTHLTLPTS